MEKRLELEKRGKNASQIKELVLDNCHSASISGLTDEFCNLETLSMVGVGLTNLKGFPKLPNLKKLDLSNNRISGGLNNLSGCPNLTTLNLSGNKIDSIDVLEPLKELSNLKYLELFNCGVASTDNYKEKVFELLTNLKYLDGLNEKEEEDESEDDELDDEEGDEDDEVGLSYLQNSTIDEESEGDDYSPDDENESDVDIEDDSDDEVKESPRGEKRKLESDD